LVSAGAQGACALEVREATRFITDRISYERLAVSAASCCIPSGVVRGLKRSGNCSFLALMNFIFILL
jgi:hypothetical protein